MAEGDTVRIKRPHAEVGEYHEWVATGESWRHNDQGNTWWFELVCNNPDCDGQALVNEAGLVALVSDGSGGQTETLGNPAPTDGTACDG